MRGLTDEPDALLVQPRPAADSTATLLTIAVQLPPTRAFPPSFCI